jgi:hypothetical protein
MMEKLGTYGNLILMTVGCIIIFMVFMALHPPPAAAEPPRADWGWGWWGACEAVVIFDLDDSTATPLSHKTYPTVGHARRFEKSTHVIGIIGLQDIEYMERVIAELRQCAARAAKR